MVIIIIFTSKSRSLDTRVVTRGMYVELTSLISDLPDGGTVRPLLSGIKGLRNVGVRSLEVLLDLGHEEVGRGVDAHQAPEVVGAGLGVEVPPGGPGRVLGVDSLDELVREDVVVVLRAPGQEHEA